MFHGKTVWLIGLVLLLIVTAARAADPSRPTQ